MAAYFFASQVDVDIRLNDEDKRKQVELKLEKERRESCPVFYDGESVVGQVNSASALLVPMYARLCRGHACFVLSLDRALAKLCREWR